MSQPLTVDSDVLAYVQVRRTDDTTAAKASSACTGMERPAFAKLLRDLADHYDQEPAEALPFRDEAARS